ncbi:MAG: hypothetical protein ACXW1D_00450 [Halobacteriota archaeon]
MEQVKNQILAESPASDEGTVDCVARSLIAKAVEKAHQNRYRGDTQSEIFNNTVKDLMGIGYTFALSKVAAGFVVARMK